MALTISQQGISFIKTEEGFVGHVYLDSCGIPTIGYGHALFHMTLAQAQEQYPNGISEPAACTLLAQELVQFENNVNGVVQVPLTQNQFDACVSFCYNAGNGAFNGSTLLRLLNAGNYQGAADQFLVWDKGHVDGQLVVIQGLLNRRTAERNIFLNDNYGS
ncbi:muraminidase [Burkholderia lata]|uniref:Lysozyme n=1 Tax=Burkholderia lata (strain ATCC 17760 / DSM 23089 / LMG 22485 / NCIMB 9086 / R18194 / 383) TaxID=482957 RepID=A0A6P2LU80_BURL3|nr:lysozyme [Burkholderia lata]VWB70887.1 muraminidase [Burkholderia lata]